MDVDAERLRVRTAVRTHREAKVKYIHDYKEANPCVDCGNFFPYYVMDFDHMGDKYRNISMMYSHSLDKILAEIAKCDLVCANCHRVRTHNKGYQSRPILAPLVSTA